MFTSTVFILHSVTFTQISLDFTPSGSSTVSLPSGTSQLEITGVLIMFYQVNTTPDGCHQLQADLRTLEQWAKYGT